MKKMLSIILLIAVAGCHANKEDQNSPADAAKSQANEYPDIILRFASGKELPAKELTGNNVFVLFQPDCDHCQEEAIHIEQRLDEFKDYRLYFISSAPFDQITAFAKNFGLHDSDKVRFAWTSTEGVLTYYGPIPTPSVYIYSNGKLKRSFNGQTDIENILMEL